MSPADPRPEEICIEDIAHALSLMTRANGHFPVFYSVAQHSLDCAAMAQAEGRSSREVLACLLHELGHLAMLLLFHRHVQTVSLCGAGALFVPSAACGAYWQDILVSLAGPAVNLLLGTAFLWGDRGSVSGMLHLGLGLFNLLPYARLDGGAVCRSVLSVYGCLPEQTERLQNGIAVLLTVLLGTVCWQFRLQNLPFCLMCVYLLWIQLWESYA